MEMRDATLWRGRAQGSTLKEKVLAPHQKIDIHVF